jgi:hypothetical protein
VATWTTARLDDLLHRREGWGVRQREARAARTGGHAEHASSLDALADRLADRAGLVLSRRGEHLLGFALKYGVGMAVGAVYAVARRRGLADTLPVALGLGSGLGLLAEEALGSVLDLGPAPMTALPWQTRARGLTDHAVFGAVAGIVLDALERRD